MTDTKTNQAKKNQPKKNSRSRIPGGSPKARIYKIRLHPLMLISIVLLIAFIFSSVLQQDNNIQNVTVDTFIRSIKDGKYSRVEIRDTGEILAQSKYLLITDASEIENLSQFESSSTKVIVEDGLRQVSLSTLVRVITPLGPLEQLRQAFSNNTTGVSELIVGENFIIAIRAGNDQEDMIIQDVNEEDFFMALEENDLQLKDVQVLLTPTRSASKTIEIESFMSRASTGLFSHIYQMGDKVYARVKTSNIPTESISWDGGIRSFAVTLQAEGISLSADNYVLGAVIVSSIPWGDIISLLTLVGFVILGFILFRGIQGSGSSLMRFGQSKARMFWGVRPDVTFKDVAGIVEAKEELKEVVEFLKSPGKFRKLGARIPKGVLMVGAPGTGKTLLARAIAGEASVPFFHTSGSEFEEMLVGAGASRVRDLFEKAKKAAPSLIFIDEIDAVARKRGTTIQSSTTEQTLNQILVEMDGFEQNINVIIIAATNRPDVLDPAILRPGRFDRRVVLDMPDVKGRKEILEIHASNKPLEEEVDMERVAKRTVGFSGADLENTLNEAAIIAAKHNKKKISAADIEEAATKVVMGPARKSLQRTQEELKLVAVHEVGHALVSYFTPHADPVHRVSIISRGSAGGVTHFLPKDDNRIVSKSRLMAHVVVALGGRAAEEIILKDISTGASNDIDQATSIVRSMVQKYGMSEKLGLIKYGESNELQYLGYGYGEQRDYSDDTAKIIDEEVRNIINLAYAKAKEIITSNRKKFDQVVELLLEKEVLESDEFEKLFDR